MFTGAAISRKSQKQRTVALSSTKAEYVSLTEAMKEALYLQSLLCKLELDDWAKLSIFVDKRGTQCLAANSMFHARTKHIDLKYYSIRETITNKLINICHVPTSEMIADVLTKTLPRVMYEKCMDRFGFGYQL